jgi:hypothetical protein
MGLPLDREELYQAEFVVGPFTVAANSDGGSVTTEFFRTDRPFRVDSVQLLPGGTLAADDTNFAELSLISYDPDESSPPETVIAGWSTEDDTAATYPGGGLVSGVGEFFEVITDEDANLVPATHQVAFICAESGTTSVPAATVVIRGRYVG